MFYKFFLSEKTTKGTLSKQLINQIADNNNFFISLR
jgi:hypothetical protein